MCKDWGGRGSWPWQGYLMRSTGCGLRGKPLYWQSSTAQAWWVISAGNGSLSLSPGGVLGCPLPGWGAGGAALLSEDADVGLLPAGDGMLPAHAVGLLRHVTQINSSEHLSCVHAAAEDG